jgi:hypothetical protein
MAGAFGLTSCPSALALKSKLLRRSEALYGLDPRLCHHGGKNSRPSDSKTDITLQPSNSQRIL